MAMNRAFRALVETSGPCVLLESTAPPGPRATRSVLARAPHAVLVSREGETRVATRDGTRRIAGSALDGLRALLRAVRPGRWPEEGGVAGAIAYDFARPRHDPSLPQVVAIAVDRFLVESDDGQVTSDGADETIAVAAPPEVVSPAAAPATTAAGARMPSVPLDLPPWSNLTRARHRELVLRIQEHIAAGDIYQANLSQRFCLPWPFGGLRLYERLRTGSPTPFAGYLRVGGLEIASASPERLVDVVDGRASARPIAGTRPRSADPETDRALARELLLSEKERAEHLMLVDLARNDLGRIARVGSVAVDELMAVEEYAHVRHIVSNVTADVAPGRDAFDVLLAAFPGGTITGVPKRRCMEILDTVEPVPRGFYTGSLFYATPSGRLDANILIRSAVVAGGRVVFHAGGGIVADSDPQREYEETLHKAEAMRRAMEEILLS